MSHSYTCFFVHIVWSAKKRLPLIAPCFKESLYKFIEGVIAKEGAHLIAVGGTHDHIHILVRVNTNCLISKLVRQVKTNSSRFVNQRCNSPHFFAWQEGYSIFSVSNSHVNKLAKYIDRQDEHHKDLFIEQELQLLFKV